MPIQFYAIPVIAILVVFLIPAGIKFGSWIERREIEKNKRR